jgi:hypothetical protein
VTGSIGAAMIRAQRPQVVLPEIDGALRRFDIRPQTKPKRGADAPLLVLPYPGGRHPRIGFLDGAVDPQREAKISVFTPWDEASYVVADIPEALLSNLGLTYLAHTHVPTIWTKQNIELDRLEWTRKPDQTFEIQRKLPNGIVFGTKIVPGKTEVRMELWLKNGTKEKLTNMRVQNCVLLKGARGFTAQSNNNKVFAPPYAACKAQGIEVCIDPASQEFVTRGLERTWALYVENIRPDEVAHLLAKLSTVPYFRAWEEKYRDQELVVIGVHVDMPDNSASEAIDTVEKLDAKLVEARKEYWNDRDIPFPVALAARRDLPHVPRVDQKAFCQASADYGVWMYPTQVLIDPQGNVVGRVRSHTAEERAKIEEQINAAR